MDLDSTESAPRSPASPGPIAYEALTPTERAAERRRRLWVWWVAVPLMTLSTVCLLSVIFTPLGRAGPAANAVKCASNLRQIGQAIELFANDNGGRYPSSFAEALQTQDISLEVFTCPSGDTTLPSGHPATWPSAWPDVCGDYVYLGAGLRRGAPTDVVVAYDRHYDLHRGNINVLFADGSVSPLTLPQLLKAMETSDGLRRTWEAGRGK